MLRRRWVLTITVLLLSSSSANCRQEIISRGIKDSNRALEKKIDSVSQVISAKYPAGKSKALAIKQKSDELNLYIEYLSGKIIREAGGRDENGDIKKMADLDIAAAVLIKKNAGDSLMNRIVEMRWFLLRQVTNANELSQSIPLRVIVASKSPDNPSGDWAYENFEHIPVIAAVTLLDKIQNDLRSGELMILNNILESSGTTKEK
jgi:gliding motility-associated GldM-like protein